MTTLVGGGASSGDSRLSWGLLLFYALVRRIGSSTYFMVNIAGDGYVGTRYYR